MKNDLYYVSYLDNWGSGITKKIESQISEFKNCGFNVRYITLAKPINKILKYLYKCVPFLSEYNYSKIADISKSCVYIRYSKVDFRGLIALRRLKQNGNSIICEIPTYPYDGEMIGIDKVLMYKDHIWRHYLAKYVDRIATYSNDSYIYNVPCLNISNFVDSHSIMASHRINNTNMQINMIAVASLAFWHGYDRVLKGLYEYYQSHPIINVDFYLVGDGREIDKYKNYIHNKNLDSHVHILGSLTGEKLNQIYDVADIAIDTLGRHRSDIYYNSTLKGKEYLAKGLPIVSGVETELDHKRDFPFYFRVPADDSPVDIYDIIAFFNKVNSITDYHEKIRAVAEESFNAKVCLKPIIDFFKGQKK